MKISTWGVLALALSAGGARAAEPVRIGVTTVLSGANYDRGQSEQYGAELALQAINEAGGVLGRPVEAFYGDNAGKPPVGVEAMRRLIDQVHVSAVIGALATPVTHAIMPIALEAKVPLIIATSAGQDFVDASGVGGNAYTFKTIPSDLDIARGILNNLRERGLARVVLVADEAPFNQMNANSVAASVEAARVTLLDRITLAKGENMPAVFERIKGKPVDAIVVILGASTEAFFKAFEETGASLPVAGRVDLPGALKAVSPEFAAKGGLANVTSIASFTPALEIPAVRAFVGAYRAKYGLTPTQRSYFVHEAMKLVVDAIGDAKSDRPADVEAALLKTKMPSMLGGTYEMDDHNHPHFPLLITGLRDGAVRVISSVSGKP